MIEFVKIQSVISEIRNVESVSEMGDWTMKLNELEMEQSERRKLFYTINFPVNAKAEFIDGLICTQEYPIIKE